MRYGVESMFPLADADGVALQTSIIATGETYLALSVGGNTIGRTTG